MSEKAIPKAGNLIDLDFFQDATTQRLLGVITALGGEVYLLKAMVNRLTVALEQQGVLNDDALSLAANSDAHQSWQVEEEKTYIQKFKFFSKTMKKFKLNTDTRYKNIK